MKLLYMGLEILLQKVKSFSVGRIASSVDTPRVFTKLHRFFGLVFRNDWKVRGLVRRS